MSLSIFKPSSVWYIRRIRETIIPPSIIRWIYAKHLIVTFRCNVEIKLLCGWAAQKIDFTDMPRSRSLFKISLIQREEVILIPFFSLVYLSCSSQPVAAVSAWLGCKGPSDPTGDLFQLLSTIWQIHFNSFIWGKCTAQLSLLLLFFRYESSLSEAQQMDLDFSKPLFITAALFTACRWV